MIAFLKKKKFFFFFLPHGGPLDPLRGTPGGTPQGRVRSARGTPRAGYPAG